MIDAEQQKLCAQLSERDPIGAAIMRERAAQYVESPTHHGIRPAWPSDIRAIPLPTHAETLAYALQLPEIKALVGAASLAKSALEVSFEVFRARGYDPIGVTPLRQLNLALAALEPKP